MRRIYGELGRVIRPGGVMGHAEEMPLVELPRLGAALGRAGRNRRRERRVDARARWDTWWEQVAVDPALREAAVERQAVLGDSYTSHATLPDRTPAPPNSASLTSGCAAHRRTDHIDPACSNRTTEHRCYQAVCRSACGRTRLLGGRGGTRTPGTWLVRPAL